MAKLTLLEIVQDILNDMDSDEVNSISDTVEATQVAQVVKTTYEEIVNDRRWPTAKAIVQLTASGSHSYPSHMSISDDVQELRWVKYNKRKSTDTKDKFEDVTYSDPDDFINLINQRDSSATNVDSITDYDGTVVYILNNVAPTYYTSFDDEKLVFDSYDSAVDSTLQASKTQVSVYKEPVFTLSDSFVPDLPAKAFPYLLAEAKSVAFNAIKQVANPKEEQRSRRQRTYLSRDKWRTNGGIKKVNYGRN